MRTWLAVILLAGCNTPPALRPDCDVTVKPLIIECVRNGGQNCVAQVERLNRCVLR